MQQIPEGQWVRFIHHLHMLKTLISNYIKHQTNIRQGSSSSTTKGLDVCLTLAAPIPLLLFKSPHHKLIIIFCVMICLCLTRFVPHVSQTDSQSTCVCGMLNWVYALVKRMIVQMLVTDPCVSHLDAQGMQNILLESVSTE